MRQAKSSFNEFKLPQSGQIDELRQSGKKEESVRDQNFDSWSIKRKKELSKIKEVLENKKESSSEEESETLLTQLKTNQNFYKPL